MSHDRTRAGLEPVPAGSTTPGAVFAAATGLLARVTFWVAVCLPVALVGLLAGGIATPRQGALFLAMVGIEVVALVAGRSHSSDA